MSEASPTSTKTSFRRHLLRFFIALALVALVAVITSWLVQAAPLIAIVLAGVAIVAALTLAVISVIRAIRSTRRPPGPPGESVPSSSAVEPAASSEAEAAGQD